MRDHKQSGDKANTNTKEGSGYRFADYFAEFDDAVHGALPM